LMFRLAFFLIVILATSSAFYTFHFDRILVGAELLL